MSTPEKRAARSKYQREWHARRMAGLTGLSATDIELLKKAKRERDRAYRRRNLESVREKDRAYSRKTAGIRREYKKQWYQANKERCARQAKERYAKRSAEQRALANKRSRQWQAENRHRFRETARARDRKEYRTVRGWLNSLISSKVNRCLKRNGVSKGRRTFEDIVGWTVAQLKVHLESLFSEGMGWHNKGQWHIDHIVPLAAFDFYGPEDPAVREAWALSNLRPMWATDNQKKSDKLPDGTLARRRRKTCLT